MGASGGTLVKNKPLKYMYFGCICFFCEGRVLLMCHDSFVGRLAYNAAKYRFVNCRVCSVSCWPALGRAYADCRVLGMDDRQMARYMGGEWMLNGWMMNCIEDNEEHVVPTCRLHLPSGLTVLVHTHTRPPPVIGSIACLSSPFSLEPRKKRPLLLNNSPSNNWLLL